MWLALLGLSLLTLSSICCLSLFWFLIHRVFHGLKLKVELPTAADNQLSRARSLLSHPAIRSPPSTATTSSSQQTIRPLLTTAATSSSQPTVRLTHSQQTIRPPLATAATSIPQPTIRLTHSQQTIRPPLATAATSIPRPTVRLTQSQQTIRPLATAATSSSQQTIKSPSSCDCIQNVIKWVFDNENNVWLNNLSEGLGHWCLLNLSYWICIVIL